MFNKTNTTKDSPNRAKDHSFKFVVSAPDGLTRQFDEICDREHVSRSEKIRELIRDCIREDQQKVSAVAELQMLSARIEKLTNSVRSATIPREISGE